MEPTQTIGYRETLNSFISFFKEKTGKDVERSHDFDLRDDDPSEISKEEIDGKIVRVFSCIEEVPAHFTISGKTEVFAYKIKQTSSDDENGDEIIEVCEYIDA